MRCRAIGCTNRLWLASLCSDRSKTRNDRKLWYNRCAITEPPSETSAICSFFASSMPRRRSFWDSFVHPIASQPFQNRSTCVECSSSTVFGPHSSRADIAWTKSTAITHLLKPSWSWKERNIQSPRLYDMPCKVSCSCSRWWYCGFMSNWNELLASRNGIPIFARRNSSLSLPFSEYVWSLAATYGEFIIASQRLHSRTSPNL
mmetsp:Transcript_11970/g.33806  ORF Transcript_11970/g.33806 Transcript_11970/m.33806 type:complete len:203 (+) Transcript_11970:343-951(+)